MKKAAIFYNSKTGTTRKLGENIHQFLLENNISSEIWDINEFELNGFSLSNVDYIFMGCWTSGLFLLMQKPEKNWVVFAKKLPQLDCTKTILFTTYKIRTGSMFRNMRKQLHFSGTVNKLTEIASRDGRLPEKCRNELVNLIKI